MKLIYELNKDEYVITIVALKCDIYYARRVSTDEGIKLAEENNCSYFEATSKYKSGAELCLTDIVNRISDKDEEQTIEE